MDEAKILKPRELRIGQKDNVDDVVVRIYYVRSDFVIYRTHKEIRVEIDSDSDNCDEVYAAASRLSPALARVYSLLPDTLGWCEPVNRQIARANAMNLAGNTEKAEEILLDAEARIVRLKVIDGRLQFTISGLVVVLIALSFSGIMQLTTVAGASSWLQYADICVCGAMGGFLSVVIGFRDLEIDLDSSRFVNRLIGTSRILIAMVAAVFAYFAVKSGLALAPLDIDGNPYGIYSLAMVAGFSEHFVPNIMTNIMRDSDSTAPAHEAPNEDQQSDAN